MEMKLPRRIAALLCALSVALMFIFILFSKKVEAIEKTTFASSMYASWDQVTFNDFRVTDGVYESESHYSQYLRPPLEGKVFSGNVTFSKDSTWQIRIGGEESYEEGINLKSTGEGVLLVNGEKIPTSIVSAGKEFNYKLSYDIVTDTDGTTYLKLGVWFDNTLYKYFDIADYAQCVGQNICLAQGNGSVAIQSDIPTTYNIANIAVPETGIVNPPVVVQEVTNFRDYQALEHNGAAIALIDVDDSLNVLGADSNIMTDTSGENITAHTFLEDYWETVIPAFRIDSEAEADALIAFLKTYNPYDSYVIADSENAEYLNKVRTAYTKIGGILEYDESLDKADRIASRRLANNNMVSTILLPEESVNVDIVNEYNIRLFNVWSYASDTAGVYDGIVSGYNGMVSTDAATITGVYESITETTLSGKPQAVGHAGYNRSEYPDNTIVAFEAAKRDGAVGIEIDPQLTSDGHVVLVHDETMAGVTGGTCTRGVGSMTLEELRALTLQNQSGTQTGKICTLDEALEWAKDNDMVVYIHMFYHGEENTVFQDAIRKWDMTDNVIAFARADLVNASLGNYVSWYNDSDVSTIGGGRMVIDPTTGLSAMDSVEHALHSLIEVCRVVNDQNMPLEGYDKLGKIAKGDTFYYQMSARGFLGLHSQVFYPIVADQWMIVGAGLTTALFDYPSMINDYLVEIDVEDTTYRVGENIELEQKVKPIKGDDVTVNCGIQQIGGDALTEKNGSYRLNVKGSAEIVYYADVTLNRDYGDLTYRLYSHPVTITASGSRNIGLYIGLGVVAIVAIFVLYKKQRLK